MADFLGGFEQAVLLALVRLHDGAYGRAVLKETEARLGRPVSAGAVYATLERLERKGLASSRLAAGTPIRDGRARRYFRVTGAGIRALNETRAALDTIWRGHLRPLKGRA